MSYNLSRRLAGSVDPAVSTPSISALKACLTSRFGNPGVNLVPRTASLDESLMVR